jgi:outer membrane protein OmpU
MNKQTKRIIMKNITKVGLSALAGSLVMVSANAVEYSISGGLQAVYSTQDSPTSTEATNGKGLTTQTDLSFNASGELDNGFTVSSFMFLDTGGNVSNTSAQMTFGMGSLGTLQINNRYGSKANAIDDVTPHAYNETWDGLAPAAMNHSSFGSRTMHGSLDYRIPTQELMGVTVNASVTMDPNANESTEVKGAVGTTSVSGTAYTLQLAHESGLEIGGGIESVDDDAGLAIGSGTEAATGYVKFSAGGLTAAYQETYTNSRNGTGVEGADVEEEMYGIAFTSGDVTVSYAEGEKSNKASSNTASPVKKESESLQVAYTMGAMTIAAAMSESTGEVAATDKYEENTLSFNFAF